MKTSTDVLIVLVIAATSRIYVAQETSGSYLQSTTSDIKSGRLHCGNVNLVRIANAAICQCKVFHTSTSPYAMSTSTRWVVADNTSPDIQYIGDSWFADTGSQDGQGNFGAPYLSTLHGTNTSASLAFNFTGSIVRVIGSNHIRNDSGVIDPQWECFVDGVSVSSSSTKAFQYPENNWVFCGPTSLSDGPHTITVNATVAKSQTFWFDRIEYLPSRSVSLENKTIRVTNKDHAFQFGTGWNDYASIGNWTSRSGSMLAFNFYGVSLSWYGHIPTEWNGNSTSGTWSIDGDPAQVFLLKGHRANVATAYNQKFFDTGVYSNGVHRLTVTYDGDNSKAPLVLAELFVRNGTLSGSTDSNSTTTGSGTVSKSSNAIIGGAIGGSIAFLIIAIILFLLYRRRARRADEATEAFHYIAASQPSPGAAVSVLQPYSKPSAASHSHLRLPYSSSSNLRPSDRSPSDAQSITGNASGIATNSTSTHRNQHSEHSTMSAKAQDHTASARREANESGQHARNPSGGQSVSTSDDPAAFSSRFVVHQDSGVRLPRQEVVQDIPPEYTPD